MIWRQALIIGTFILGAVLIELTVLTRLGIPGATPDLVVVTVVAIALAMGPVQGAVAGFSAGVLVDLAPPGDTLVGVNAIVYVAIGFVTGYAVDPRDRTVPVMMGMTGLATGAAVLLISGLDTLLGSDRVDWEQVPELTLSSALYGILLAPALILGVAWVVRKATPEVLVE
ncbi:MAG: rod shape-determining protein MreD [Candidatus Nanopelagicales bacterium]|nr:rod shape-determining protein MreD [Candidatus Nanopelagicales bacterium]MCF8537741.1 rod shape-determining protein MreD [Candidatus Nanopelagicales bacterium]MCF8542537.1 rod shape-determining protein MreD [Candidatus Nanopelagicales bacterium]MCF8557956.1 rod shape-determining protein MreD [Candidatus Nanopelagicales bacterium]